MKIAIITPLYFPSIGGTQASLLRFAEFLHAKGDAVRVFTSQAGSMDEMNARSLKTVIHFPPCEIKDGVEIWRYPCGGLLDFCLRALYALSYKGRFWFHPALYNLYQLRSMRAPQIVRDLKKFKPDAILIKPYTEPLVILALSARRKTGAKLFVSTSLHLDCPKSQYSDRFIRRLKAFDAVMTNTEYERSFLKARGIDEAKIHVTGVGIDTKRALKPLEQGLIDTVLQKKLSSKKYVLYLGRKQDGKGLETLIAAMEKVRTQFPEVMLVLAGESTEHFDSRIVPLLSGKDFCENADEINDATKQWLFQNASVFSMVSNVDSFGIVYLEAWLCKKPVIGADLGAMRCVVDDGWDGFLVPYGDDGRLADKIIHLLKHPEIAGRMGERGYEKVVKKFGNHAIEQKMADLIHAYSYRKNK